MNKLSINKTLSILLLFSVSILFSTSAFADYKIILKNGREFVVDNYKESNGKIKFYREGGEIEIDRSNIKDIKKVKAAISEQPTKTPTTTATESPTPTTTQAKEISSISLVKKIEISGIARPEIVATDNRVFVVYLESSMNGNSFKVKIYDNDLTKEIVSKTLVSKTSAYGNPTDIRIVSDGTYLYAFYEMATSDKSYLFGEKYKLDDNFEKVVSQGPIVQSVMFRLAQNGDEKLDDPAPMIEGSNIYVMTRYKSSYSQSGETKYRLYKFDNNLNKITEFGLDLSAYADGGARQSSIIYDNGYYYIVLPTSTGSAINESAPLSAPADILMVKLDKNWNVKESKLIASESGYTEGYVTGLKVDDKYFYITYNQVIFGKEFSSVIKIYDKSWKVVLTEKYRTITRGSLRPSLEVTSGRIYAANEKEGDKKSEIYIFDKK